MPSEPQSRVGNKLLKYVYKYMRVPNAYWYRLTKLTKPYIALPCKKLFFISCDSYCQIQDRKITLEGSHYLSKKGWFVIIILLLTVRWALPNFILQGNL